MFDKFDSTIKTQIAEAEELLLQLPNAIGPATDAILHIQQSDEEWDYTIFDGSCAQIDGGVVEADNIMIAAEEIATMHDLAKAGMEPHILPLDLLEDILEAAEQKALYKALIEAAVD